MDDGFHGTKSCHLPFPGGHSSIVAYKIGSEQKINLVLNTIKAAWRKEKVTAELQLHSDQGFQYTSQAYFKLTQKYGITPSMSRRGNPYDNALQNVLRACGLKEAHMKKDISNYP